MELCPILDIIGDYSMEVLQGSQFCCFCNIILGINKYDITSFNVSGREFLEERKIKLERDKVEAHKAAKLPGD